MSINRTEDTLENQLVNRIAALERTMLALTTSQPVGADIVDVLSFGGTFGGALQSTGSVAAGDSAIITFPFVPTTDFLTVWEFQVAIHIDGTAPTNAYPAGSALTAGGKKFRLSGWVDRYLSEQLSVNVDAPNARVYTVTVKNEDSSAHTYHVGVIAYLPKQSIA